MMILYEDELTLITLTRLAEKKQGKKQETICDDDFLFVLHCKFCVCVCVYVCMIGVRMIVCLILYCVVCTYYTVECECVTRYSMIVSRVKMHTFKICHSQPRRLRQWTKRNPPLPFPCTEGRRRGPGSPLQGRGRLCPHRANHSRRVRRHLPR